MSNMRSPSPPESVTAIASQAATTTDATPAGMQMGLPMPMPMSVAGTLPPGTGYYAPTSLSGVQWMVPVSIILSPTVTPGVMGPMIGFWPASNVMMMCDAAAATAAATGGCASAATSSDQISTTAAVGGAGANACAQPAAPVVALPASSIPAAVTHPASASPLLQGAAFVLPQTVAVATGSAAAVAAHQPASDSAAASRGVCVVPAASASASSTGSSDGGGSGAGRGGSGFTVAAVAAGTPPPPPPPTAAAAPAAVNLVVTDATTAVPQGLSLSLVSNGLGQAYLLPTGSGGFWALGTGSNGNAMQPESGVPMEMKKEQGSETPGDETKALASLVGAASAGGATAGTGVAQGGVATLAVSSAAAVSHGTADRPDAEHIQLSLSHLLRAASHNVPCKTVREGVDRTRPGSVSWMAPHSGNVNSSSGNSGKAALSTVTNPPALMSAATSTVGGISLATTPVSAKPPAGRSLTLAQRSAVAAMPPTRPPSQTTSRAPAGSGGGRGGRHDGGGGAPVVVKVEMGEAGAELGCDSERVERRVAQAPATMTDSRLSFFDASKDRDSWRKLAGSIRSSEAAQAGQVQGWGKHWPGEVGASGGGSSVGDAGPALALSAPRAATASPAGAATAPLPQPPSGTHVQPLLRATQSPTSTTDSGHVLSDDDDGGNGDGNWRRSDRCMLTWDLNAEYEEQGLKAGGAGDTDRGHRSGSASTRDKQLGTMVPDASRRGYEVGATVPPNSNAPVPGDRKRAAGDVGLQGGGPGPGPVCHEDAGNDMGGGSGHAPGSGAGGAFPGVPGVQYTRLRRNRNYSEPGKYRGVRQRGEGRFSAELKVGRFRRWLGSYKTAEEAARAFDRAAYQLRGSEAKLNFPLSVPQRLNNIRMRSGMYGTRQAGFEGRGSEEGQEGREWLSGSLCFSLTVCIEDGVSAMEIIPTAWFVLW